MYVVERSLRQTHTLEIYSDPCACVPRVEISELALEIFLMEYILHTNVPYEPVLFCLEADYPTAVWMVQSNLV